ncbi:MAG: glutamate-5-semialdehyde dehydrogenase [Mariniblastus sp.]|nr:glutamate-5-semialdehyde dehydrogenase [Mariniblastus sp.]MDG2183722.1 glutamate-5-semialdehyde dehydrogenase [Mariniblastus sp.]
MNIAQTMRDMGHNARASARILATTDDLAKSKAIRFAAASIISQSDQILVANRRDQEEAEKRNLPSAMLDRLKLNEERVESIATGLNTIADLPNPVGEIISTLNRPNGLRIDRVRTPLGVIGVIYESRPNVTADAGALCLKSGNAVILRGGSDSYHSATAIHDCLLTGLLAANLPPSSIQLVPTTDRAAVGELLTGLNGNLDVVVPRGGKGLVSRIQNESRVPVFAHLDGICHVYVDREASLEMAIQVVLNSKMRRPGICGAAETLLIDTAWSPQHVRALIQNLQHAGCEVRAEQSIRDNVEGCLPVNESDWTTEYLDAIISVKLVDGVAEAIEHINQSSSQHTESIVTANDKTAARFLNEIDSAILMHNASTQFADGGEFGMGAEIGIATGKMHARGPVGVEQLTCFNYRVHGSGQIRPD